MLAAGLAGIEEGLEPPAPIEDRDLFTQPRQELLRQGYPHASRKPWSGR